MRDPYVKGMRPGTLGFRVNTVTFICHSGKAQSHFMRMGWDWSAVAAAMFNKLHQAPLFAMD